MPISASPESQAACLEFVIERLRNVLLERGWRYDLVDAILAAQGYNPARAMRAIQQLAAWISRSDWSTILPAYARCVRITRDQKEIFSVDPAAFAHSSENALYEALLAAETSIRQSVVPGSPDAFLNALLPAIPVINRFFEDVLVMADQPAVRANRLGLLQRIAALAANIADMSRLEGF